MAKNDGVIKASLCELLGVFKVMLRQEFCRTALVGTDDGWAGVEGGGL